MTWPLTITTLYSFPLNHRLIKLDISAPISAALRLCQGCLSTYECGLPAKCPYPGHVPLLELPLHCVAEYVSATENAALPASFLL